jgi:hypothetical protein
MRKSHIFLASFLFLFAATVFASTTSTLVPTADGTFKQWTPSTGTSHFALVDETACNTTDYNSTNTAGNRDSYSIDISSIPAGSQITQIEIIPCASKNLNGGSASLLNVFYRFDGVNSADAGSYSLSATSPAPLATTTFSGLALNRIASSTLEVGAVLTSGSKGAKLSKISTVITYTP